MVMMGIDFLREHWYVIIGVILSLVVLWMASFQGEANIKKVWRDFLDEIKDPATLCIASCLFTGFAILWLPVLMAALIYRVANTNQARRLKGKIINLARNVSACFAGLG